jgi:hypothetical protein
METLELVGAVVGIGAMGGLSLYLTLFVLGLSIHLGWIDLLPALQPLHLLENPWIWGSALVLYIVEFGADKIPWVDSAWDLLHTLIRPIGVMLVAAASLGSAPSWILVLGVLLVGSTALATHITKSGARLLVNTSPEPFSNTMVSVAEDLIVVGGAWLALKYPLVALGLAVAAFALFCLAAPPLFRLVKTRFRFLFSCFLPAHDASPLPADLPHDLHIALSQKLGHEAEIGWAVPCITGKLGGIGGNITGYLTGLQGSDDLYFTGWKWWSTPVVKPDLSGCRLEERHGWTRTDWTFYRTSEGVAVRLLFARTERGLLGRIKPFLPPGCRAATPEQPEKERALPPSLPQPTLEPHA